MSKVFILILFIQGAGQPVIIEFDDEMACGRAAVEIAMMPLRDDRMSPIVGSACVRKGMP